MLNWVELDSSFIEAGAYEEEAEVIHLRFKSDGAEWAYEYCSGEEWVELTTEGQSPGEYFHKVLKHKPAHQTN
jgi:KTSC domain